MVSHLSLETKIDHLFMVGPTYAKRLKSLNINNISDLLHHYPFRYNDFCHIYPISQIRVGETVTIQGEIISFQNSYSKSHKQIQKAIIQDNSGQIEIFWFNQPFLKRIFLTGSRISLSGKVGFFNFGKTLISPEYEIIGSKGAKTAKKIPIHTARLVPIYPETYGVSSKWLRSRIAPLLEKFVSRIPDWLPEKIKKQNQLIDLNKALQQIHFPQNQLEIKQAKKRLSFDELFLIQLANAKRKQEWQKIKLSHPFSINKNKINQFIKSLPFQLTSSQNKTVKQILNDLKKNKPMNRLLQGDVGSGKTVIAAIAIYAAFLNKFQSALMAPTEILSQQHFQTIKNLLQPFGVKVVLLTSSHQPSAINHQPSTIDVFIGTHALIYKQAKFNKLGLIVIDEQHRFGVEQRAKLIEKGESPHLLTMTATPIPRTVALTLYGDLDLATLKEMPLGRQIIKTWVVSTQKRNSAYEWIKKQIISRKTQAFIVCPLIEKSTKESMKDIKAATEEFKHLSQNVFPGLKLGLLHGRMKTAEKEKVINQFKKNKINILVSTPVIEVGIDIANATIIVVEAANRFGLAQLHQLRGRVGRSNKQSYCLLFNQKNKNSSRLQAMVKYNSGFKLAEIDFRLRGPGEIYGLKQHGFPCLKIASFQQTDLIQAAQKAVQAISKQINLFSLLKEKLESYTIKFIKPN